MSDLASCTPGLDVINFQAPKLGRDTSEAPIFHFCAPNTKIRSTQLRFILLKSKSTDLKIVKTIIHEIRVYTL